MWVHVFVCCDDWLVILQYESECREVWEFLLDILVKLGFYIHRLPHRCIALCTVLPWLGLQLDSRDLTIYLPADKVEKALGLVQQVLVAKTITRKQLYSLFGYLSFCSTVVFGGRAFLHGSRRLRFRGDGVLRAAHHRIRVNQGLRQDMRWWDACLDLRNGDKRVPIVAYGLPHERCDVCLDARGGSGGVGGYLSTAVLLVCLALNAMTCSPS